MTTHPDGGYARNAADTRMQDSPCTLGAAVPPAQPPKCQCIPPAGG